MTRTRACRRTSRRRATWLSFFVVALASLSVCSAEGGTTTQDVSIATAVGTLPSNTPESLSTAAAGKPEDANKITSAPEHDQASEATRALKHALQTLSTLTSLPPSHTPSFHDVQPNSILSSLFPNQQGPMASTVRIIYKLRQQSWMPRFISVGFGPDGWISGKKREEMKGRAVKVLDLLEHAIELGNTDALYKLAQVSLFSSIPLLHNVTRAFEAYTAHAQLTGNATSQTMLAYFYATGYEDVVDVDQAQALLYYTFAAHGGEQGAQMGLGYRFWAGIGVNDDCTRALDWYQAAAEYSMAKFLSGPPGGRTLPLTTPRLSDLAGGVYGPGASVASTGLNAHRAVIKAASARQAGETWEDVLEYYMFNADRGEIDFAYRLGKIFYQGSIYALPGGVASGADGVGAVPRDFARARAYFLRIARAVWPRDNPATPLTPRKEHGDDGTVRYAAAAASFLGRMYLRGEGVPQDAVLARMWFERGKEHGERESFNGLGIIWRDGLVDGKTDPKKALLHFGVAAGQELAEAQVNLGKIHYMRGETKLATTYFETAVRHGSPFEAYYYLAEIYAAQAQGTGTPPNLGACAMAVSFYKLVAERGVWAEDLLADAAAHWAMGTERGRAGAMLRWWLAAERGIEAAQNNLAYVLDQDTSILRRVRGVPPSNTTARLALTQWSRAAAQRNLDALVKVGDYYFRGLGVPDEAAPARWERAAAYYQAAADTQISAMAAWNLGWMYENGVGVPQDFHLAKRHYDMALETNGEAYLPVMLSLIKLHVRSLWHTLMGGSGGLSLWADEDPVRRDARELDGAPAEDAGGAAGDDALEPQDDGQWYMGRAREEHNRRLRGAEAQRLARGEEEDPIEWARERRNAESREGDFGPEDYFDGALRGGRRGEAGAGAAEDEFAETMLLVALCLAVSLLVWVRGRWVERRRREEEERRGGAPPQGAGGGVFPPPGDPGRDEWAVLR